MIYTGQFEDSVHHGFGIMERENGYRYEGHWAKGARSRQGVVRYPDGAVYEGLMAEGERNGKGTITLPDGFTYTGDFQDGQITDIGSAKYANGDTYIGAFREATGTGQAPPSMQAEIAMSGNSLMESDIARVGSMGPTDIGTSASGMKAASRAKGVQNTQTVRSMRAIG